MIQKIFKAWDSVDDRITAISNLAIIIVLPIVFILFCVTFMKAANAAQVKETPIIQSQYDDKTISEVVSAEVDRQLKEMAPVRIEFVNAEVTEPEQTALYYDFIPMSKGNQAILFQALKEYHVGAGFALALIESESTFNVDAIAISGGTRYYGAWQISEVNAYRFKEVYGLDITVPEDNLVAGCIMLHELIEKYGAEYGTTYVINAYKGGEGAAAEWYAEGFALPCCDEITGRAMYYEELMKGVNNGE